MDDLPIAIVTIVTRLREDEGEDSGTWERHSNGGEEQY